MVLRVRRKKARESEGEALASEFNQRMRDAKYCDHERLCQRDGAATSLVEQLLECFAVTFDPAFLQALQVAEAYGLGGSNADVSRRLKKMGWQFENRAAVQFIGRQWPRVTSNITPRGKCLTTLLRNGVGARPSTQRKNE